MSDWVPKIGEIVWIRTQFVLRTYGAQKGKILRPARGHPRRWVVRWLRDDRTLGHVDEYHVTSLAPLDAIDLLAGLVK